MVHLFLLTLVDCSWHQVPAVELCSSLQAVAALCSSAVGSVLLGITQPVGCLQALATLSPKSCLPWYASHMVWCSGPGCLFSPQTL